jgi:hypothetical protein
MDSCGQPGKSSMATGTQRLRLSPFTGGSNLEPPSGADGLGTGAGTDGAGAGADGMVELVVLGMGKRGLDGGGRGSGAAQETSMPTMASFHINSSIRYKRMLLILLEALAAGLILVLIVWWTMFHGRQGGEREDDSRDDK